MSTKLMGKKIGHLRSKGLYTDLNVLREGPKAPFDIKKILEKNPVPKKYYLSEDRAKRLLKLASLPNETRKKVVKLEEPMPKEVKPTYSDGDIIQTHHLTQNGSLTSSYARTLTTSEVPGTIQFGNFVPRESSTCLDANYKKGLDNRGQRTCINIGDKIRILTPTECERLQGYPDDWTKYGVFAKGGSPVPIYDSARYKMIGNGVSSPVSLALLTTLIREEDFPMKAMSTFSGCGGTEILLPKDKYEVVGHSEIDNNACAVLKYHYPNIPNFGDISKINVSDLPEFNLLLGGFPCTDISIAGRRDGLVDSEGNHTRSGMFFHLVRILEERTPKYFMFENVKNLLSHDGGKTLEIVVESLVNIGYSVDVTLLNTLDFGIPQRRERVFIVGKFLEFL